MATDGDRHSEISDGEITVVQLASSQALKAKFLAGLQSSLVTDGTLGALIPGHAKDVYFVPQAVEAVVRARLDLADDSAWETRLRAWGALAVNRLTRDAAFHILQRGAVVVDGAVMGTSKISATNAAPAARQGKFFKALPSEFQGPYDWHLDERGANVVAAWRLFAASSRFQGALPWSDLRVGHIDTGYTEHAALAWNSGSSATVHVLEGHDYWDNPTKPEQWDDPRDDWLHGFPGHGTRIGGAITGFAVGLAPHPFYGTAPGVGLVPFRVTDSVIVDHKKKEIALAIERAVDTGCCVINISLGALFGSSKLASALDYAYERGVIVVCAAGQVWGEVIYPGRYNRCITMGGVGPGLKPWRSAARGIYVDLCGPADRIRRIKAEPLPSGVAATEIYPSPDGDGTSYATATCSGIAALWLAWHGIDELRGFYGPENLWCIPAAFKTLARQTATPGKWSKSEAGLYGSGVINAAELLKADLPRIDDLTKAKRAADVFDPND